METKTGSNKLLIVVGAGEVGEAVGKAGLQSGYTVHATTRSPEKATYLEEMGFHPILLTGITDSKTSEKLKELCAKSAIVYSIPPQAKGQDQFWMDLIYGSAANSDQTRVYISSTAVYGASTREIDESTVIDTTNLSPWGKDRLEAENAWRFLGGNIMRVSAFYGPFTGPVDAMVNGYAAIAGAGQNWLSLVHLEDLAEMVLKAVQSEFRSQTFLATDGEPVQQVEMYRWLSERLSLPMPPSLGCIQAEPHHARQSKSRSLLHPCKARLQPKVPKLRFRL